MVVKEMLWRVGWRGKVGLEVVASLRMGQMVRLKIVVVVVILMVVVK